MESRATTWSTSQASSGWLYVFLSWALPSNIDVRSVTLETSQPLSGWLNWVAKRNMECIVVTWAVSHPLMSSLKADAPTL